jgi:hypothetical protein
MPYGNLLADVVQGSTANTPPVFKDGNSTEIGTLCRAWVNFNGTGTVAIRASFNVSSITDNGTGDYTVNFTTAMPDANYSATFGHGPASGASPYFIGLYNGVAPTSSSFRMQVQTHNALAFVDSPYCLVAIDR